MVKREIIGGEFELQISSFSLIKLDGFEQRFEVACTESLEWKKLLEIENSVCLRGTTHLEIVTLNDFEEERRSVLHVLCEDLQQVSVLVVIDEDLELPQNLDVFFDLEVVAFQALLQHLVVSVRHLQEFLSTFLQVNNAVDDVIGVQSDVLDASAAVVVDILLNLRFLLAVRRFVDRHFHGLLVVGDDDGAKRGVLCVDLRVVHGPETVELQATNVPLGGGFHLKIRLISDAVVDEVQIDFRHS